MRNCIKTAIAALLAAAAIGTASAGPAKLTVQVDKPGHEISPTLYGLFFEEINCAGDGGIYAELVRNRSFEESDKPDHWTLTPLDAFGLGVSVDTASPSTPSEFNKRSLKVTFASGTPNGVVNGGYWGMSLVKGDKYNLSLKAKADAKFDAPLIVRLTGQDGKVYAEGKVSGLTQRWKDYKLTLTSNTTDPKARLHILSTEAGTVWLDVVSLFPANTWKGRENGLRPDLAEMLVGLNPKFLRFPGGCWVEGNTMAEAMRWKNTIGPISDRRTQPNLWGYQSGNGLGYHEYLQMAEDLKAEPLFVINCGMSHRDVIPMDKMDEYVQDALDAIEYANGPVTSKWGALRAKAGHPEPFNLNYFEVGNENGGPAYNERWPLFYKAIKAKYPEMVLIANVWGGWPKDPMPDMIDEHYYATPEFFASRANMYDSYDRKGPKIYVGEYAVTQGSGQGNLRGALGEAAFMTGIERNSDIVAMACYAPLFANINYKRWNPDLINFDSSRVYGTPSYYVQQMFAQNLGERILPVDLTGISVYAEPTKGAVGVGAWLTQAEYKDITVTRGDKVLYKSDFAKGTEGWKMATGKWSVVDGALRETSAGENCRAVVGDPNWVDYTVTLKARKVSGEEGFLVMFRVANENSYAWWNLGGWGNTKHAIEWARNQIGSSVSGSIETGKWYDIKIDVTKERVKCYLDGKLLHDVELPTLNPLHATASLDKNGDTILKVVNMADTPQDIDLTLAGAKALAPTARAIVLTSASGYDENSIDQPKKVFPKETSINVRGTALKHTVPANSVTVVRFKPAK